MVTTNLEMVELTIGQAQKETTVNTALGVLDGAVAGRVSIATADANVTLTDAQAFQNMTFDFTGAMTAGRNVVVPDNTKMYVITNSTTGGFDLTVKTSAGSGIAVSAGSPKILSCDGTNVIELGGAGPFTGDLLISNGNGLVVGHSAQVVAGGLTSEAQILGTAAADAALVVGRWSADAVGPTLILGKSRNAAIGSFTIVADDDVLGQLQFAADDGADLATIGAAITAEIDGTPGANDMPTRLVFLTTADAASTPTERLRISAAGVITVAGTLATTPGSVTLGAAATVIAVTANVMTITGDGGGNTVATLTGGTSGMTLTLIFIDALVTITDDGTHGADSVDLSAAFTSADDTTLQLVYDGTSWYELSRSVN